MDNSAMAWLEVQGIGARAPHLTVRQFADAKVVLIENLHVNIIKA